MIKQFIILLLLLKTISTAFGQDLKDIIITNNDDTIICNITLVNDDNIFYQFKKKKNIKTSYIAKNMVLDFTSTNLKSVTVKRKEFEIYNKCDTCTNWIIDSYGDTIFYNLDVKYARKEEKLIEYVRWSDSVSSQKFTSCDIKEAYWNGIKYFSISPDLRYETTTSPIYNCNEFLGYYVIQDETSLIKYASYFKSYNSNNGFSSPTATGTVSAFGTLETAPEYCVEIFSNIIKIPKINKHFRITMMNLLYKDSDLVSRLENKEFKYQDIEEVIKIYNLNQK